MTQVENAVHFGQIKGAQSSKRRATVGDVVRADNFITTETQSRAELKYADGSVVRIGQNTIFSFDADSRTLSLEKGSLVFFIPKGSGGGTVKTPSLTAAITGTIGKVSKNMIAILEGVIVLQPSGQRVAAGQFAQLNPDGTITVAPFDLATATEGRLMNFNGPLPGFDEKQLGSTPPPLPDLSNLDAVDRVQNSPSGMNHFSTPAPKVNLPKPQATPVATPVPTPVATPKPRPRISGSGNIPPLNSNNAS